MQEDLIVPASIEEIIQRYDSASEPLVELLLQDQIGKARKELKEPAEAENLGAWAEALAFGLFADKSGRNPWNTYFGPMATTVDKDGKTHYHPDIAGTPSAVLTHWRARSRNTKHPILKARYADLVWDLTPFISQSRRDPEMGRLAIDAYIASATPQFRTEVFYRFDAIQRALNLAIILNDVDRIDAARGALMAMHREAMKENKGQWWQAFDRLIQNKKVRLTDDEKKELIGDLETVVERYSNTSPGSFDPHGTEAAAKRLIKHYSREYRHEDTNRLYAIIGRTFEHFASLSDALLASALLQTSVEAYRNAGRQEDSDRVRVLMQTKIGESKKQMAPIGGTVTIKKDDVEAFLKSTVLEDLGATFVRLAVEFLPKRADLERVVKEVAEKAPLMAHLSQQIMADDRIAAIVGSADDDMFGRVFQQAKFTFSFSNIWLLEALNRAVEVHNLVPEHFVGWANRYGLFDDTGLLLQGVRAWYDGDPIKAVHVLVPQIEHALRSIVGQLGKPVTKAHQKARGVSVAINMGDILYSDEITEQLGPDLTLYFLALYADPRGVNLRNELAHGLLDMDLMHDHLVRLLIHTLLVLGLWKELAAQRP